MANAAICCCGSPPPSQLNRSNGDCCSSRTMCVCVWSGGSTVLYLYRLIPSASKVLSGGMVETWSVRNQYYRTKNIKLITKLRREGGFEEHGATDIDIDAAFVTVYVTCKIVVSSYFCCNRRSSDLARFGGVGETPNKNIVSGPAGCASPPWLLRLQTIYLCFHASTVVVSTTGTIAAVQALSRGWLILH